MVDVIAGRVTIGPAGTQVGEPNQRCQGDSGYNNFFGKGIVDALKSVTEAPGQ